VIAVIIPISAIMPNAIIATVIPVRSLLLLTVRKANDKESFNCMRSLYLKLNYRRPGEIGGKGNGSNQFIIATHVF